MENAASKRAPRLVVITGATGGIGQAIARRLAADGHRMVLMGRRSAELDALRASLADQVVHTQMADLTDPHAMDQVVAPMLAELGPVDVLVNNAGAGTYGRFLEQSREAHERLVELNYFAPANMIRLALPGMIEAGRGHVINIASMSSKHGPWGHAGYASAKAALVSLTQTLASEYASPTLHFTYVNPGIIDTPYFHQPAVAGLWELVKKRAISPDCVGATVARVLARPKLEVCVPASYAMLDVIRAISLPWAHRLVTQGSRRQPDNVAEAGIRPPE